MTQQISLNSRIDAIKSPLGMPAPLDFGFEEMVKMKAELDNSMLENAEELMKILLKTPRNQAPTAAEPLAKGEFSYPYNALGRYDVAEELEELKRRKNRK